MGNAENPLSNRSPSRPPRWPPADARQTDLIECTGQTIVRHDAQTGRPVWDSLAAPSYPGNRRPLGGPPASLAGIRRNAGLIRPAPDLDGDGTGDLVFFSRNISSILAVSGTNGLVLWEYAPELDGPGVTLRMIPDYPDL